MPKSAKKKAVKKSVKKTAQPAKAKAEQPTKKKGAKVVHPKKGLTDNMVLVLQAMKETSANKAMTKKELREVTGLKTLWLPTLVEMGHAKSIQHEDDKTQRFYVTPQGTKAAADAAS